MSPDSGSGGGRRLSIPRPGPDYGSRVFYDDRAREDELRDWHHRRNWSDWRRGRTSTPPPYPEVWW